MQSETAQQAVADVLNQFLVRETGLQATTKTGATQEYFRGRIAAFCWLQTINVETLSGSAIREKLSFQAEEIADLLAGCPAYGRNYYIGYSDALQLAAYLATIATHTK